MPLARGEIIAFRVEIRYKKEEEEPVYNVMVKHQGLGGTSRVIKNATQTPESLLYPRNYLIENVYRQIKKYYLSTVQTVSSPVFAFTYMLRQIIEENNDKLTALLRESVWWANFGDSLNEVNLEPRKILLAQKESQMLVPLLEKMRDLVGASDSDMWTRDTVSFYGRWLRNGTPMNCYVKYYFCEFVMRYYLDAAKNVFDIAYDIRDLKDKISMNATKKKKKKKKKVSHFTLAGASPVSNETRVTEEINAFTSVTGRLFKTYKTGGPDKSPLSLAQTRQPSNEAKKAAIEASLSVEVVPATEPHFHICLDANYLEMCIREGEKPEPLLAVKISHVRRYRAANVHTERSKILKVPLPKSKEKAQEQAQKETNSIVVNNRNDFKGDKIVREFETASIKFIRRDPANLQAKSERMQKLYEDLNKEVKGMQKLINTVKNLSGQDMSSSEMETAAEGGGESKAKDAGDSAAKVTGESAKEEEEEEERFEPIKLEVSHLVDNPESANIKKQLRKVNKLAKLIKNGESALKKLKGKPEKLITAEEMLQKRKDNFKVLKRQLYMLWHKIMKDIEKE